MTPPAPVLGEDALQYMDVAHVIMVVLDREGHIVFLNRAGYELLGYEHRSLAGRDWFEVALPGCVSGKVRSSFLEVVTDQRPPSEYYENAVRTRDGDERTVAWQSVVLREDDGSIRAILSSGQDVTRQRELEAEAARAAKLEAIAQLAAGVAHDFNNLLTAIMAHTALLRRRPRRALEPGDLGVIDTAAERGAALVAKLMAFSRRSFIEPTWVDPAEALREMQPLLESAGGEGIALELICEGASPILVEPHELTRMMVNLVGNARDALPAGGTVAVHVADRTISPAAPLGSIPRGDYVVISVHDEGEGMSEETLARLFEPFYTTKALGQGTGLGLATVYGTMSQLGGYVHATSSRGAGATLYLVFPREATAAGVRAATSAPA